MGQTAIGRVLLLSLALLAVAPAAASAERSPTAKLETTSRLNLRSCPNTSDCPILYTLPLGARLSLVGDHGDWIQVKVVGTSDEGWVHSDYVRLIPEVNPSPLENMLSALTVDRLALALWVVVLFVMTVRWLRHPSVRKVALAFLGYASVGFVVVFSQFGQLISSAIIPLVDLKGIRWLWEATSIPHISFGALFVAVLSSLLLLLLFAPGGAAGRRALLLGTATGLFVVPTFLATLGVVIGTFWVLGWILKWIAFLIWSLLWPLRWLGEHVLLPLLIWIATPLLWCWEVLLFPAIKFIAPPFVWLWQAILAPVFQFVQRFIMRPAFLVFGSLFALIIAFSPFAIAGMVAVDGARRAFKGSSGCDGIFSQGVVIGVVALDLVVALLLSDQMIQLAVPGIAALAVGVVVVGVARTALFRQQGTFEINGFGAMASTYMKTSGLEVVYACALIPLALLAQLQDA